MDPIQARYFPALHTGDSEGRLTVAKKAICESILPTTLHIGYSVTGFLGAIFLSFA